MTTGWHLEDVKTLQFQKKKANSSIEKRAKDTVLAQKGSTNGDYTPKTIYHVPNWRAR